MLSCYWTSARESFRATHQSVWCERTERAPRVDRASSPSCRSEYAHLTSLKLDHNCLTSLAHLDLPSLKVLSVHHNRLASLGEALRGVPQLLQLSTSATTACRHSTGRSS